MFHVSVTDARTWILSASKGVKSDMDRVSIPFADLVQTLLMTRQIYLNACTHVRYR